ncbi:MAG: tetratricopeptide repeat protein [Armatimonadetes bacterium]|nr:tetratricopeptide repeat protein [Armatimonadota bacterium]
MANERIQHLRELLLQLLRGPVDSMAGMFRGDTAAMFDDALPEIVRLRYYGEVPELVEEHKLATIAILQKAVALEGAGPGGTVWGSPGFGWDNAIGFLRRNKAAAFGAALAVVVAIVLLVFGQSWFAGQPDKIIVDTEKPAPEVVVPGETGPEVPSELVPDEEDRTAPDEPGLLAVKPLKVGEIVAVVGRPILAGPGAPGDETALPNMAVYEGMTLETGDADMLEILFEDGSSLAIAYNTRITVTDLPDGSGVPAARRFRQDTGTVWAKVAQLEAGETFEIETPVATAVAFGTEFGLELRKVANPDAGEGNEFVPNEGLEAVLTVRSGRVAFFNDFGRVEATEMTESVATAKSAPSEPKRLPTLKRYTIDIGSNRRQVVYRTEQLGQHKASRRYVFPCGRVGMTVATLPGGEVRIVAVYHDSAAREAGLRVGDDIVAMDGAPIHSAETVRLAIYRGPGRRIGLTVDRKGETFEASMVAVLGDPPQPSVPSGLADRLKEATWPAMSGETDSSLRMLRALAADLPHASVYNNLGVVYETQDEMGMAIRRYQAAVRLDPKVSLYRYNLGLALKKIGNFERSVEELEKAVELDRGFHDAALQLSHAYALVDRFADALAVLEAAQARRPTCNHVWLRMSQVLSRSGRHEEARDAVTIAIELDPDSAQAYNELGLTLLSEGRLDEVEAAFRKATELDPTDSVSHKNLGKALKDSGRLEEAETVYRKAIELDPSNPGPHNGLGIALMDLGRLEEAETEYRKAIELDPQNASAHSNLGIRFKRAGRFEEAEAMMRKAIELDPENAKAQQNLGVVLYLTGRMEEAEAMYRKAIALHPKYVTAHVNLALLLGSMGRFQESMAEYVMALEADPKNPYLYAAFGWSLIENHRWEEAVKTLRRSIEIDPNGPSSANVRQNLGYVLILSGNLDQAESVLTEARRLKPEDLEASVNWALLLAYKGIDLDDALERAKKGAQQPDAHAFYWEVLGFVHFKRGEFDEAIEPLEKAAEGWGKSYLAADALVVLGMVYEEKGDASSAKDAYHRALSIEQGNKEAAEALKRLGG